MQSSSSLWMGRNPSSFILDLLYLKGTIRETEGEIKIFHSQTVRRLGLGQAKPRARSFWDSDTGAWAQAIEPFSAAFLGILAGSWNPSS